MEGHRHCLQGSARVGEVGEALQEAFAHVQAAFAVRVLARPFGKNQMTGGGVERQDEDMALIAMVVSILRRRHGQVQAQALTLKAL